jgi:hypothetical protein
MLENSADPIVSGLDGAPFFRSLPRGSVSVSEPLHGDPLQVMRTVRSPPCVTVAVCRPISREDGGGAAVGVGVGVESSL